MNTDTGHLVDMNFDEMKRLYEKNTDYEPVPKNLRHAAGRKLNGKKEAMVSLTSGGKLSRWAASKRKKKRQMAKASRQANRHQGGK